MKNSWFSIVLDSPSLFLSLTRLFSHKKYVMYSDGGGRVVMVVTFNVNCMELRRFLKIYFKTASFSLSEIRAPRFAYTFKYGNIYVYVYVFSILMKKIGEATLSNFVCIL